MVEGPRMSTHACIPLRTPDPDVRDRVGHSLRAPVGRRLPVWVVRNQDIEEEVMEHGNRTRDIGKATSRERMWQYGSIWGYTVRLKKKHYVQERTGKVLIKKKK